MPAKHAVAKDGRYRRGIRRRTLEPHQPGEKRNVVKEAFHSCLHAGAGRDAVRRLFQQQRFQGRWRHGRVGREQGGRGRGDGRGRHGRRRRGGWWRREHGRASGHGQRGGGRGPPRGGRRGGGGGAGGGGERGGGGGGGGGRGRRR